LINSNGSIIIPVVVHVIYNTSAQNISDDQINSQIDVLNEDYRRLNADRVNTPNDFLSKAADYNIEFRLACLDPNGNPTNGIVRKYTQSQSFSATFDPRGIANDETIGIKSEPSGDAPWSTDKYLNIWVCNLSGNILGYSTWPVNFVDRPQYDGVVIKTTAFGRVGNVVAPFHLGRTASHEIAHWLNLKHLNDSQFSCVDDLVGDTPKEQAIHSTCTLYPDLTGRCDQTDPSTMFMNFMEYVPDDCMNLFTNGQKIRSRTLFATMNGISGPRVSQLNNYFGFSGQPTSINCRGKIAVASICLPVTWTVSGPGSIISGDGTNQIVLSATSSGIIHLTATSGNYFAETDINATVGTAPNIGANYIYNGTVVPMRIFSGDNSDYNPICNLQETRTVMQVNGATSVYWSKVTSYPTSVSWSQNTNDINFYLWSVGQTALFRIEASNTCGTTSYDFGFKSIDCSTGGGGGCAKYSVSKENKTSLKVIVPNIPAPCRMAAQKDSSERNNIDWIKIYDMGGKLRLHQKFGNTKTASVNTFGLLSGVYIIEISDGTNIERQKVIIRR
jgi:hypothetical protein